MKSYSSKKKIGGQGPVGMGLCVTMSPTQTAFYIILILLGITVNTTVVGVIEENVFKDPSGVHNSDINLMNMALSNLLMSVLMNALLVIADLELGWSGTDWCCFLMGVWVWLPCLVSSPHHTRPAGLFVELPSSYAGLTVPIMLMAINNLASLYTLYAHSRTRYPTHMTMDAPALKRVPSKRRAAKVIPALIMLFNGSWGASLIAINYFNYNQGLSAEILLVTARFAYTIFNAISPIVLAVGHRRLRAVIKSILTH
uniref:G-protein coupled receptors family 1 profile domain-containing protein n=1 Tax=Oncorhynchus tshawytscha TaxID=74940 RepID=A0AAZ3R6V3_ONCTS